MRESEDLELWIGEQMNTASSEEYGQYYEQLLVKRLLTLRRLFIEKYWLLRVIWCITFLINDTYFCSKPTNVC